MPDVFTVVAKLYPRPGKEDEVQALLLQQVEAVRRHEPDCLVYRPHRLEGGDRTVFLFYEQYRSREAFEFHRTAPHLVPFRARHKDLLDRPTEVEFYRSLTD